MSATTSTTTRQQALNTLNAELDIVEEDSEEFYLILSLIGSVEAGHGPDAFCDFEASALRAFTGVAVEDLD